MNNTKIKLCGLSRPCDIEWVNELKPEFIGFVFAVKSKRYVSPEKAAELKRNLSHDIKAVGVFVNESIDAVAKMLNDGIIDIAQLHGAEDEEYIETLRKMAPGKQIIKAFRVDTKADVLRACESKADYILLDSGNGGTGTSFDWSLLTEVERSFFLAGGLGTANVESALSRVQPFAVDVSSGIESDGVKDIDKMREFVRLVRKKQ